jgi:hypothetical protein
LVPPDTCFATSCVKGTGSVEHLASPTGRSALDITIFYEVVPRLVAVRRLS